MAGTTDADRAKRRRKVATRLRLGESQAEIAEALGWSRATISRDVDALRERWRERADREFGALRGEHLATLRSIRARALRAWMESREDPAREKVRIEGEGETATSVSEDGDLDTEAVVTEVEEVKKETTRKAGGDPRFLRVALAAERQIATVYGVSEPEAGEGGRARLDAFTDVVDDIRDADWDDMDRQFSDDATGL